MDENRKSAQLGVKSVNIKFMRHGIQFHPGFISLMCEIVRIEKAPDWAQNVSTLNSKVIRFNFVHVPYVYHVK